MIGRAAQRALAAGVLALAAASLCACSGVQTPLDPAADQAASIKTIWNAMLVVCGFMYLLVLTLLGWALARARRKPVEGPPAEHLTEAEPLLERGVAGWAALIVAGLVVLITVSFLVDRSLAETGPDPLNIRVSANQWWWQIEYQGRTPDETFVTANELHLPLGRPARITLVANDVIHSFWVPNLSGKEDLIPGRTNYLTLTPRRIGEFRGQCAEFCGLEHAKMALLVQVQDPRVFEAWRQQQRQATVEPVGFQQVQGKQVFQGKACVMCHRIGGTDAGASVGPDLTHLASRRTLAAGTLTNDRGSLQAWIADPQGVKPGTAMPRVTLSSDELNALTAYLESLK